MTRKPVDQLRTARALRQLDPQDLDQALDRLPRTDTEVAAALGEARRPGRPPAADPTVPLTVRVSASVLAALDAALDGREPPLSRQEAVRVAIARWLRAERRRR